MRRADKEITGLENQLAILDKCETLRIGLCADNMPYVVPMHFAYELVGGKPVIYLHCATEGRKLDIIAKNDNVCFEADIPHRIIKSESGLACGWSAEFESVIGDGKISVITDETERINALDVFMKRYGFEGKPVYAEKSLAAVAVLRINVERMTAKSNIKN